MARGQLTYLNLTNGVLIRLGKAQIASADFAGLAADSWGGIVKTLLNDAQREIYKEHDWTTLITSGTFTTSSRTVDLSTSFSNFGREIDLVDTTNGRMLTPVLQRDIDRLDPELDNTGTPWGYSINYPDLLFTHTPSSIAYRLRYLRRPTDLSASGDVSLLPEYCDMPIMWHTIWQLAASREDWTDNGASAQATYQETLARAIGQDQRTMDRFHVLRSVFDEGQFQFPRFPAHYPQGDW